MSTTQLTAELEEKEKTEVLPENKNPGSLPMALATIKEVKQTASEQPPSDKNFSFCSSIKWN